MSSKPRQNRFMRSSTLSPASRWPGLRLSRTRPTSRDTFDTGKVSLRDTSGTTSLKTPMKLIKARTLKQKVKRLERVAGADEIKYKLVGGVNYTITPTPTIILLNDIVRGDAVTQRDGDKIKMLKFELNGMLTSGNISHIRMMLIADKNPLGTTINFATSGSAVGYLFQSSVAGSVQPWQMYNFNNTSINEEFNILYDKTHSLMTTGIFSEIISIKKTLNIDAEYKGGNAGTVADLSKNALYLVFFAMNNAGGTPTTTTIYMDHALYFDR